MNNPHEIPSPLSLGNRADLLREPPAVVLQLLVLVRALVQGVLQCPQLLLSLKVALQESPTLLVQLSNPLLQAEPPLQQHSIT